MPWYTRVRELAGLGLDIALFRHKTRKQPFGNDLRLIAVLQLGAAAVGAYFFATGALG